MLSNIQLVSKHVCDQPMYECLTFSCTLDRILCKQCFNSRYLQHEYHSIIQISADITENNGNMRMEELYNEKLKKQDASQIQMPTHVLLTEPRFIRCLTVSQDGQIVACTDFNGKQIFVYYLNKPTQKRRYWDERHYVTQISISPNNEYLIGYGNGYGMILWNLNELHSSAKRLIKDIKDILSLQFTCDSTQIITSDKTIKVWDCHSGKVVQGIQMPNVDYFRTSTQYFYTFDYTSSYSAICQFMKSNGKFVKTVYYPGKSVTLECANNEIIIVTQYKHFKVIHVRTGKVIRSINWQGNSSGYLCPQKVGYSLQSLQFAALMDEHKVTKFCMSSLKEIKSWETSKQIQLINLQEDGQSIYIVNDAEILRFV